MHVDLRDAGLTRELFLNGVYEGAFQRLAAALVLKGSICVDVGANIGVHTLHLSRLVGPSGKVIALEPDGRNFELLNANIEENRALNVEAVEAAAGEVKARGQLRRSRTNFGDHRLQPASSGNIEIVVLDDLLDATADGQVAFVKIDVQGSETFVLRGLSRTLARNPEAIVLLELSPSLLEEAGSSASELLGVVANLGLSGWEIGAQRVYPIAPAWVYETLMKDDEEHLLLCRRPLKLDAVLQRFYGAFSP